MLNNLFQTKNQNTCSKSKSFGFLVLFLFLFLFLPNVLVFAQESASTSECNSREECEALLKQYEEQINQYDQDISKTEQEKNTLKNQISVLKKKVDKLSVQINQSNLVIKDLGLQIKDTESSIGKTSVKIDDSKVRLANILQVVQEEDQKPLIEILFSEKTLSDFFDNLTALEALNSETQKTLEGIKTLKTTLETQKQSLDSDKTDLQQMVIVQQLQKKESENTKKSQENYLKLTEAQYQQSLKEKQGVEKKAAEIRARIFELIGVPKAPTFGEALSIAQYVEQITGIRPALLMAVLTQESNIGKNVGQCYLKNTETGAGVKANSGTTVSRVMNPARDVPLFLEITQNLGRNFSDTPVSCPMSIGWGGAMGPAQFIPQTWKNYAEKVREVTGKTADPWNIKDAFLGAGLYLKDLGVLNNEFKAVMRYFSGSSWSKWEEFYGNSVLSIAKQYEQDIKEIE
jgi:membrane-bound lytic murein transglycosylase B/copper chaperone CopZ